VGEFAAVYSFADNIAAVVGDIGARLYDSSSTLLRPCRLHIDTGAGRHSG
jgi:hypothetical protein